MFKINTFAVREERDINTINESLLVLRKQLQSQTKLVGKVVQRNSSPF